MRTCDIETAFRRQLLIQGLSLDELDAAGAVEAMATFYFDERITDVDLDNDGDMLLLPWGIRDDADPVFLYDITRQVIGEGTEDDANLWQLSLTLHFPVPPEPHRIEPGNRWCPRPEETEAFLIASALHPAVAYADTHHPTRVELIFDRAG
ncbi:hypothetical protein [Nocardia grenadensis]